MKIIKPEVQFFGEVPTEYNAALKFIEMAGRTCYKSEDKITPLSASGFVRKLIKAGHLAMVEHSNFVVRIPLPEVPKLFAINTGKFLNHLVDEKYIYVGGNLTAWFQRAIIEGPAEIFEPFCEIYAELFGHDITEIGESNWEICPHDEIPKELHRYAAKFICDRGVSHELVRHRPCSFAQESTRYVNYAGKDMEFIAPDEYDSFTLEQLYLFDRMCVTSENFYNKMIRLGQTPQQARALLINALKTEIVVTADAAEWAHIRKLRTAKSAHPDMQRVMNMMPWDSFLA